MQDRRLLLAKAFEIYLAAEIDQTIAPDDMMNDQWYFPVGRSAAEVVHAACASSWVGAVRNVLDLPCGHGRVLRHLVKLFPEASFDAVDTDRSGVDFCAKQFGARGIYSHEGHADLKLDKAYDLIWMGSLFTHFSRQRTRDWLAHMAQFLSGTGIIVATFHGRFSAARGAEFGYIDSDNWAEITRDYQNTGYGYRHYKQHGHGDISSNYGVSLSKPSAVLQDVESIPGVRIYSYVERGWAGHQDVLVLGKPGLMD